MDGKGFRKKASPQARKCRPRHVSQAGAEEASVAFEAAATNEPMKQRRPRVDWAEALRWRRQPDGTVLYEVVEGPPGHAAGGRLQDANGKNPIRFSLRRRVSRHSRRPSAPHVAAQPGEPCPPQQRPSAERDGPACLESEMEGVPGSGRRAAAEQGRPADAGGSPERLVGTRDRPRGLAARPAAKGRGGRPGGAP